MPDYRAQLEQLRDSFNARDPEGFATLWNPDCEWHPFLTARVEGDPGYHGHNGIRAWFEDIDEMYSAIRVELGDSREVAGRLLVLGQMTATGRDTVTVTLTVPPACRSVWISMVLSAPADFLSKAPLLFVNIPALPPSR